MSASDVSDGGPVDRLRAAWIRHVAEDAGLFDRLVTRHREKHRRYHAIEHVDSVVRDVQQLAEDAALAPAERAVVVAAAMYHDAIYEPRSSANERASARLARRDLTRLDWAAERIHAVAAIIEGTAAHRDPASAAAAILFDADLAILGATEHDYEAYRLAVREEYAHVDDAAWSNGRATVLQSFLDRPSIYSTQRARQHWEARARRNLAAEIDLLRA